MFFKYFDVRLIVPGDQQKEFHEMVRQTKILVNRTLMLFEELHSFGCWLIEGPKAEGH